MPSSEVGHVTGKIVGAILPVEAIVSVVAHPIDFVSNIGKTLHDAMMYSSPTMPGPGYTGVPNPFYNTARGKQYRDNRIANFNNTVNLIRKDPYGAAGTVVGSLTPLAVSKVAVAGNAAKGLAISESVSLGMEEGFAAFGAEMSGEASLGFIKPVGPNAITGIGYGVNDDAVRLVGPWTKQDLYNGLNGRYPKSFGQIDLHHAGQMPGSGIHEIEASLHRWNKILHPNLRNQGVDQLLRNQDRQLHWWYRAQEMGGGQVYPNSVFD